MPGGVNRAKLSGWVGVGGGGDGVWFRQVRRQMAVDWPAVALSPHVMIITAIKCVCACVRAYGWALSCLGTKTVV